MKKDPTEFRKRFALYKQGKSPYKDGRPIELDIGTEPEYRAPIMPEVVIRPDNVKGRIGYDYSYIDPKINIEKQIFTDPQKWQQYWGQKGADYMHHGMNTGFGKTMQDFANLISGSAAGTAVGSTLSLSQVNNPIHRNAAKQLLTSTIGGESVNLGSKALTGRTIGENVADLAGVDKNSGWRLPVELVGEMLNFGWRVTPTHMHNLFNVGKRGFDYAVNKGADIVERINGNIHKKYTLADLERLQSNYDSRISDDVLKVRQKLNGRDASAFDEFNEQEIQYIKEKAKTDEYFEHLLDEYNLYKEIEQEFPQYIKQANNFKQLKNMTNDEIIDATTETINIGGNEYKYIKPEYASYIPEMYPDAFYLDDPIYGTVGVTFPESKPLYNFNELIGLKPPKISVTPRNTNPVDYNGFESYREKVIEKINQDIASNGPLSKFMSRNNLSIDDILPYIAHPERARKEPEINRMVQNYIKDNLSVEGREFSKSIPERDDYVTEYLGDHGVIDFSGKMDRSALETEANQAYDDMIEKAEQDFLKQHPEVYDYIEKNFNNAFEWKGFTYIPLPARNWGDVASHELSHLLDGNYYGIPGGRNGRANDRTNSLLFKLAFSPKRTNYKNYFLNVDGTEYEARGTQLKNFFDSDILTKPMLKNAEKTYVKRTGLDNNMSDMFRSIIDWDAAAKWFTSHAKTIAIPAGVGVSAVSANKQNNATIKRKK